MNERELVSIIVPVYQVKQTLGKCLDSLLHQTYSNIEIIIIDDGSTDGSAEICDKYAELDSRIHVFHRENGGVSSARNAAIKYASGTYICFADSDDNVEPEWVSFLHSNMCRDSLSICGYYEVYPDKKVHRDAMGPAGELSFEKAITYLLKENYFRGYLWNKMFDKQLIDKNGIVFDESMKIWEDVNFVYQYMKRAKKIVYDPKPLYNYIFNEKSATHIEYSEKNLNNPFDAIKVLSIIRRENKDDKELNRINGVRVLQNCISFYRNLCFTRDRSKYADMEKQVRLLLKDNCSTCKYLTGNEKISGMLLLIHPEVFRFIFKLTHRRV